MPPFAAISASHRAAAMVLLRYLLTTFGFLRALQLGHARTSPITVGRVAGSTFIFRETTVQNIRGTFTFRGGGLSHVLQRPNTALPRVTVGLRRPPSRTLLSRGRPSLMLAQILVHLGVILPSQGQFDHQTDQVIVRVRPRFPLGHLSAVLSCPGRHLPHKPQMRLSRPIGRGVHTPHELFQLRQELGDAGSCREYGEGRQLLNLRSDTQVCFLDRIHFLQSFQEVAPVAALLFFFFFFCNTSPKPQLQCSQEASPIYIESPTSPSQGSAGRQAGVTAAAGRCKVVNYATKWTSQKWSPHTPRPGAVADNLGVLSGRVPVLSGYPIIRGKHWYIGRETRGSSGGGGVGSGRPGRGGSPTGERRKWHSTRMV